MVRGALQTLVWNLLKNFSTAARVPAANAFPSTKGMRIVLNAMVMIAGMVIQLGGLRCLHQSEIIG